MKKKVKELEKNGVFHSQWSALMSQTRSKIGLAIVLLFVAAAVFAPLIAPNDPLLVDVSHKLEGPSSTYWLGTDQLGRCIASRLLWGGRNSLLYGAHHFPPFKQAFFGHFHAHHLKENVSFRLRFFIAKLNIKLLRQNRTDSYFRASLSGATSYRHKLHIWMNGKKFSH